MICQGDVPIRDLNREFGWGLPEDVAITIAGLVLHEARRIPEVGQIYAFYGFRFEILKREGTRIAELRIVPPAAIQAANSLRRPSERVLPCRFRRRSGDSICIRVSVTCQGFYPRRRAVGHRGPHHRREDLRACQRMARAVEARRLRARHVDPAHGRPSLHHRRCRGGDRQVALPDLRQHRARLQEADRACASAAASHRAVTRAAGRRARLHAHRRAAGPGGDDGVPDRGVGQGARPQTRASPQDRQAAQAARSRRKPQRSPTCIDNCYAWASDGEVTKRWAPQFYTGPDAEAVRDAAAEQRNRDGRLTCGPRASGPPI